MRITWTSRARNMLRSILLYGEAEYGRSVARRFFNEVQHYEVLLAVTPRIGAREPLFLYREEEIRYVVIRKRFKLLYYIGEDTLHILAILNCRRNIQVSDILPA